ncbi:MAG: arginyltransferase [Hyphomicrobiales bacterium]|nr:arginyltransferase [Hyphomicrobiales bacterium]
MRELRDAPQFYMTAPSPCPYLPNRFERKVFTHLIGRRAHALNDALTHSGFRRSQTIAYRPACETCRACVSVRVLTHLFEPNRSMRRALKRNGDITRTIAPAQATSEHYSVFRAYVDARHGDGGMADMSVLDFSMMVEDSHVTTNLVEYRRSDERGENRLIACCLTDTLIDGLSMVYSFYEPDEADASLGVYMILDHVAMARERALPHLYLGYWVQGSHKMDYKSRFRPQERLTAEGWDLAV